MNIKKRINQLKEKDKSVVFAFLSVLNNSAFAIIAPIYVLFLRHSGLSVKEVSIVSATFMISVFLLEVPTGIIADLYGRKISTIVGWVFRALSFFVYYLANSFYIFLLAEVIGAIGQACVSGAFSSWLRSKISYEEYLSILSKTEVIIRILGMILNVSAGYLVLYLGYKELFLAGGILLVGASILGLILMKDEKKVKRDEVDLRGAEKLIFLFKVTKASIFKYKILSQLLFIEFIIGMGLESIKIFWIIKFVEMFGSETISGYMTSGISVTIIIGAWIARKIAKDKNSVVRKLVAITVLMALCITISAITNNFLLGVSFFFIYQIFNSIRKIIQEVFIQEYIDEEVRASMSSLKSMIKTIGSVIGLVGAGFIVDITSIRTAWIISSMIILISSMSYLFIEKNSLNNLKKR